MTFAQLSKDPAIHFVAIGIAIWLFHDPVEPNEADRSVEISAHSQAEAWAAFEDRNKREPSQEEWEAQKSSLAREAILVEEARRLGLEKGDPIVRRRLVQKMEALTKLPNSREPTEEELGAHYNREKDKYTTPDQISLEHRFFSRDKRGISTRSDGAMAVKSLRDGQEVKGDPFLHGSHFSLRPVKAFGRLFGDPFIKNLPSTINRWTLVDSSFGIHAVRILSREESQLIPLADVRDKVVESWKRDKQENSDNPWLQEILSRYETTWAAFPP